MISRRSTFYTLFLSFAVIVGIFKAGAIDVAYADAVNVHLNVAVCNMNLVCEPMIGETYASCPSDCTAPPPPPQDTSGPGHINPPSPEVPLSSSTEASRDQRVPIKNEIGQINIAPQIDSAVLTWRTSLASLMTFSWGKDPQYESGSLAQSTYSNAFDVKLENLEPGTIYYYKISLHDSLGKDIEFEDSFSTLPLPDIVAPKPADKFTALLQKPDIILAWNNSSDADLSYVRLVRSTFFYPKDILDGKIVYEGKGQYVRDADIVTGQLYYYSLFSVDTSGNVSSPAIIAVGYPKDPYVNIAASSTMNVNATSTSDNSANEASAHFPDTGDQLLYNNAPYIFPNYNDSLYQTSLCSHLGILNPEDMTPINVSDISIVQHGKKVSFSNGDIAVNADDPVQITIREDKNVLNDAAGIAFCINTDVPEIKKGYLFTYDKENAQYQATLPPFLNKNSYDFYVGMLKYKGKETVLANGRFTIQGNGSDENSKGKMQQFLGYIFGQYFIWWLILLILILAYIARRLWKLKKG